MKEIVIIGSGGFAKEVAFLIEEINKLNKIWSFLGFIDKEVGKKNGKYSIINNDEWLIKLKNEMHVAIGVGDPKLIKKLSHKLAQNPCLKFPNIIHPNANGDWKMIELGMGNIVTSGINFTTDIQIGSFNVFNLSCTIGHDAIIGSYNVFNPTVNISGGVKMGDEVLIGTGAQILQYVKITDKTIVGAGSVVTRDITESGTYVGIPARKIK